MEMVAARCSVCGGDVQMDASMQSGTCLYCGAKMVFEEAIKNAGERARAHALLRLGWDALAVHNWKEAMRYAGQALEQGAAEGRRAGNRAQISGAVFADGQSIPRKARGQYARHLCAG